MNTRLEMEAPPSPGELAARDSARSADERLRHCVEPTPGNQDFSDLSDDADITEAAPDPAWRFKWQHILASFLAGRAWHALDAVRGLHTTCLHSDVAGLEARGLRFDHERVTVTGYGCVETPVVRYRLRPESYAQARALLGLATPSSEPDADTVREYRRASGG